VPVIMISALDEMESIARCLERGAEDYLAKPFNTALLRARLAAVLEKKRLREWEQRYLRQIEAEQARSERLLLSILPRPIADRLKQGETPIADSFAEVTVLFADLVGFTAVAARIPPKMVVQFLDEIFSEFDALAKHEGLEKIKTIGDAYMAVAGLPVPRTDHAEAAARMALGMYRKLAAFNQRRDTGLQMRLGLHSGPVIAGVIGRDKFIYDLWGDTVNTASRMETLSEPDTIQVSEETARHLQVRFLLEARGQVNVKGKGVMNTFALRGLRHRPAAGGKTG